MIGFFLLVRYSFVFVFFFFFFNDTATTEIYTLSLTTLFRSPHVVADQLALARVHADAHLEPQLAPGRGDRERAAQGARGRPVERRQKTVTDGLHLAPAKALELLAHVLVVARQQIAPVAVADVRDARGGPDDVGEQHRAQRARDLDTARAGEELL